MSYQSEVLADSPVAYWRLGDTSGTTAADTSGNSHPGTYNNATLNATGLVSGDSDKAVTFDGSSSYMSAGTAALNIVGQITLEAIIKVNAFPSEGSIYTVISRGLGSSARQGYALDVRTTGGVHFLVVSSYHNISGEDASFSAQFDASGWSTGQIKHVVGLYDGTAWKIFVNGSQVVSTNQSEGALSTSEPTLVGAYSFQGANQRYFNGVIDEAAVYSTALTPTRILAHATAAGLASGALNAGSTSATPNTSTTVTASSPAAAGGTAPYSYQFQRAPDASGSPGSFSDVGSSQSSLGSGTAPTDFADTGLTASTKYWYRVVVTDSAGTPATADSIPGSATTFSASAPTVSAVVPASGGRIDLTFSTSVTGVSAADFSLQIDGNPMAISSATGSGTSWKLNIGLRWMTAGQVVLLSYSGTATVDGGATPMATFSNRLLTNSSATTDLQSRHVGRQFGMFFHFNLQTFNNVEIADGTENANTFNPTSLNIDQWLDAAQAAGAKYCVLTVRHCGGFCLWPSTTTAYTVAAANPWWTNSGHYNIVQQFSKKCRARGLGVGYYFSVWDRNWESAHPGFTSADYTQHTVDALTELLTQNGPVDFIWTDGWGWRSDTVPPEFGWSIGYSVIPHATIYNLIKSLQPNCLQIENNHELTTANSEVIEHEHQLDGEPDSTNLFPAECCHSPRTSDHWFWHSGDTVTSSVSALQTIRGNLNGNRCTYLLNVPPDDTGKIQASDFSILSQIGIGSLRPAYPPVNTGGGINGSGILGML